MSITLVFHGGLFVVLPGAGSRRKATVYLCGPKKVKVTAASNKRLTRWEDELTASSVDFISTGALSPPKLPIRRLSHLLPVDYNGFRKVVGFTGGSVKGEFKGHLPQDERDLHLEAQSTNDPKVMLKAFKKVCGITHNHYDDDYKKGIVQEFAATRDVRRWKKGYRVEVQLKFNGLVLHLDGLPPKNKLQDKMRIEFLVAGNSPIPHFLLNNPHVLEQPPTI